MTPPVSPQTTAIDHFVPDGDAHVLVRAIAAYLHAYAPAGTLVVDPFCQSSDVVREALASGHRVIAISFNPLDALRTRLALCVIPAQELTTAVTRLADSPKADVPLRKHLQRLYRTACPQCGKEASADYFIWERGGEVPRRVHYRCASCGDVGLRDCDENDIRILNQVQPRGLHYWYVLDRIAGQESHARRFAASLLELYTPRALYVLSNILLKIETLFGGSAVHDYLRLGLLDALEQASKLHSVPGEPAPPHGTGLHPPARFVEWNAWQLFEETTRRLAQNQPTAPVALATQVQELLSPAAQARVETGLSTGAPQQTTQPPLAFVAHMTVRQLARTLPPASASLIWAQPPPPGRMQWALPYLWTGWLYGHEKAALLWPLVRRRTLQWNWYLKAMQATFLALQRTLQPEGHMVLVSQNKGLAHHEALTLAAAGASLRPESMLYHPREPERATRPFAGLRGDYRSVWMPGPPTPTYPMTMTDLVAKLSDVAVAAAEQALQARGEAAPFARLHCHIWEALARRGILQRVMARQELSSPLDWVRERIREALQEQVGSTFVQVWEAEPGPPPQPAVAGPAPGEPAPEGECLWWLVHAPSALPLTERVERAVYETLAAVDSAAAVEVLSAVYTRFPGVLTPDAEWMLACLRSYGQEIAPDHWALREGERPAERAKTRERVLYTLRDCGQRLGYEVKLAQGLALRWVQGGQQPVVWAILDTAALSPLLDASSREVAYGARRLAVITDARQDLVSLRWVRSPLVRREFVVGGWQFVRESDLERWAKQQTITLADLDSLVSPHPQATDDRKQLPLM